MNVLKIVELLEREEYGTRPPSEEELAQACLEMEKDNSLADAVREMREKLHDPDFYTRYIITENLPPSSRVYLSQ